MQAVRVLGIDPGSRITGYGIIETKANQLIYIDSGIITVTGADIGEKLGLIFTELQSVIAHHKPQEVSIEKVFMHRNADSAIKLGQARGAAIAACAVHHIPVFEYTANQIKQATVGKGHAAKQQMQHMVKVLLSLADIPPPDAADALAGAVCHSHSRSAQIRLKASLS